MIYVQLGALFPALSHLSLCFTLHPEELRPLRVTKSSLARAASKAALHAQSIVLIDATRALCTKITSRRHVADVVSASGVEGTGAAFSFAQVQTEDNDDDDTGAEAAEADEVGLIPVAVTAEADDEAE